MVQIVKSSTFLIITPQASMTVPNAVTMWRHMEKCLLASDVRDFALDLAETREVDGAGLGIIVKMTTAAKASGRSLYLYRPSKQVLKALHELEIHGFFPILEYEEDLLAHIPDPDPL